MNENAEKPARKELDAWTKKQMHAAVEKLTKAGVFDSPAVEAKPAWALPFQILIGKIRDQGGAQGFFWFICGEVPTDFLPSSVAATPRKAARHFSLKWQMAASQYEANLDAGPSDAVDGVPSGQSASHLAEQAEALYDLTEEDRLWLAQERL